MTALACAMVRSAAATSGRLSSNSDGTPIGIAGTGVLRFFTGIEKVGSSLTDEGRDSMLIQRTIRGNADSRRFRVLKRHLRLSKGLRTVNARLD